jgi:hypothetical protein
MSTRPSTRVAGPLAVSLAAVLFLSGCGAEGSDNDPDADRTGSDPTSAPTGDKSPTPPVDSASTSPAAPALETRLLSADELPGVNETTEWDVVSTAAEDGAGHGTCQKFSLVDIGAQSSLVRSFTATGDIVAVQVLGEFADAKSAWRAHQVVRTWAAECAEMLDAEVEKVSELTAVPVPGGVAEQQLLQYGDEDAEAHTFAGVGITRRGSFLSIVQIDVVGQDYNYDAGEQPAARAAKAAHQELA